MKAPERLSLIMLGVVMAAAVCILGYTRCSQPSAPSSPPVIVDTLAVPVPSDQDTMAVVDTVRVNRRQAKGVKRPTAKKPPEPPIPPRDYLDETL